MTHDQIIVSLPFERSLGPFKYVQKKDVGFDFTNRLMYRFRDLHNIKLGSDFDKWVEANGQSRLIEESLYCAALAYSEATKKKENFTKETLQKAVNSSDKSIQERILTCWKLSQTFGATIKKKQVVKRKKT